MRVYWCHQVEFVHFHWTTQNTHLNRITGEELHGCQLTIWFWEHASCIIGTSSPKVKSSKFINFTTNFVQDLFKQCNQTTTNLGTCSKTTFRVKVIEGILFMDGQVLLLISLLKNIDFECMILFIFLHYYLMI